MSLKPFWNYYGGKYRAAPHYPSPMHTTIVEPFAGAAGYSLRYPAANILLIDKDPVIAEVWRFLIGASRADVLAIPIVESTTELPDRVRDGARHLVGFAMNFATTMPCTTLSAGNRKLLAMGRTMAGWTEARRERVANQVAAIKHWQVMCADYRLAPDVRATWFVDPPYQQAGQHYRCGSGDIDFGALGQWCRERQGQVIACESVGADWLPFKPFRDVKSFGRAGATRKSREAIWTRSTP